ncbi:hypothetical protein [Cupriavidus pauculus]|uniref:hypothetical protein n=1 Tax=Cupriavidus pauculus TaxID=82633 RepID=UPI0015DD57AB|nr:hypothetical protein [Cupriavidus pauculus]
MIDPHSVRVCNTLDYEFARLVGTPTGAFSARAAEIDWLVWDWLERHPDGL